MPVLEDVLVADLRFDVENPRLAQANLGQRDTIQEMARSQGRKLQKLAEDIVTHGLDPSELMMVIPAKEARDAARIVLDGNRRLTALRTLENPEVLVDAVPTAVVTGMRRLSHLYQVSPLEMISCLVFKDRSEADHWIELRHTGEREGAGPVLWGSEERGRSDARRGGRLDLRIQALDFLEQRGAITSEFRRGFPTTTFKRLIDDRTVQAKVGITVKDGKLEMLRDEGEVAAALTYIANDIHSRDIKVTDVYYKNQRADYINALPKNVSTGTTAATMARGTKAEDEPSKARATRAKPRDNLVPQDCILMVDAPRLGDIENELRRLSLGSYPNAISVLFRVFFELSADAYISRNHVSVPDKAQLATKVQRATHDLVTKKKLTPQQAKPVNKACQKDSYLGPSITLMHDYIHNIHMFPTAADLRSDWNSLQPWFTAVWGSQ